MTDFEIICKGLDKAYEEVPDERKPAAAALVRLQMEIEGARELLRWRPIEEAPKGSTTTKEYIDVVINGEVVVAYWEDDRYAGRPKPFWNWDNRAYKAVVRKSQPTVWRPRPVAPADALTQVTI